MTSGCYSLQSHANHDSEDTSSLYGSYRSQYANLNAGYYSSSDSSQQLELRRQWRDSRASTGRHFAQPLGSQFAIVNANGASGLRFQNYRGVRTD